VLRGPALAPLGVAPGGLEQSTIKRKNGKSVERFSWMRTLSSLIGELTAFDAADRPSSLSEPRDLVNAVTSERLAPLSFISANKT
jgi:hypothetical protein